MSLDLFIAASGTEVGKTFVAERLIEECRMRGISCDAIKPIVTGFDDSPQTDTARLLAALELPVNEHTVDACSPWRFAEPVSPHIAAQLANQRIALNDVIDFCKRPADARLRLIEGIGGVMVPINERETTLDWMAVLGVPVVLVVGTYLGAISHALSAYEALRARSVTVQGIVINESGEQPMPFEQTQETIRDFCAPTPVAALRRSHDAYDLSAMFDSQSQFESDPAFDSDSLLGALQLLPY